MPADTDSIEIDPTEFWDMDELVKILSDPEYGDSFLDPEEREYLRACQQSVIDSRRIGEREAFTIFI